MEEVRETAERLAVQLLKEIGAEFVVQIQAAAQNRSGAAIPAKSTLIESFSFDIENLETININGTDYVKYVEAGRRPGVRRVPIRALLAWIEKYKARLNNVPNDMAGRTRMAFAIQSAIFRRGLRRRPFIDTAVESAIKTIDPFADLFINQTADIVSRNFAE